MNALVGLAFAVVLAFDDPRLGSSDEPHDRVLPRPSCERFEVIVRVEPPAGSADVLLVESRLRAPEAATVGIPGGGLASVVLRGSRAGLARRIDRFVVGGADATRGRGEPGSADAASSDAGDSGFLAALLEPLLESVENVETVGLREADGSISLATRLRVTDLRYAIEGLNALVNTWIDERAATGSLERRLGFLDAGSLAATVRRARSGGAWAALAGQDLVLRLPWSEASWRSLLESLGEADGARIEVATGVLAAATRLRVDPDRVVLVLGRGSEARFELPGTIARDADGSATNDGATNHGATLVVEDWLAADLGRLRSRDEVLAEFRAVPARRAASAERRVDGLLRLARESRAADPREQLALLGRAIDVAESSLGRGHDLALRARRERRDRLATDGRLREAGQDARALVARLRSLGRSKRSEAARATLALAELLAEQGRDAEAVGLYDSALATAATVEPAGASDDGHWSEHDRVEALRASARALRRLGETKRAVARATEALAAARRAYGADDPRAAATRVELGHARFEAGEFRAAIPALRSGAATEPAVDATEFDVTAVDATEFDVTAVDATEFDATEDVGDRATPPSLDAWVTSARLGEALRSVGRAKEGLVVAETARAAIVERLGAKDPVALLARLTVARCHAELGRHRRAERELLALRRELARAFGGRHPWARDASRALVALYEAWGKPDRAARFRRGLPEAMPDAASSAPVRTVPAADAAPAPASRKPAGEDGRR